MPKGVSALSFGGGGYNFAWMPDSSAFLMTQDIKWGPDRVYLAELGNPAKPRLTDLAAVVADRVRPAFKASKMPAFNDHFDFIFVGDYEKSSTGGWDFTPSGDVAIDCTCTNQPRSGEPNTWQVHWEGVWSRSKQCLIQE
jgi:hypothetical protein